MTEYVVKTLGLTKIYSDKAAISNMDIHIKKGDIYGLIGKNGAGKTTLLRIITGLAAPTRGQVELFSKKAELNTMRRRLGCIIEMPALYPNMTASENLEHHRRLLGIPNRSSVEDVLEIVRLKDTGKKKVKDFSLGMKQRLGIAMALLGNPDFLILDEPINGLDPIGIIEIRELLLRLNHDNGITVLISSHILGEITKLVTCYGIINNGELVDEFTARELEERCKKFLKIRVNDVKKACLLLETVIGSTNYTIQPDNSIRLYELFDKSGIITAEFARNNVSVEEITAEGQDLEGYFMGLMGGVSNV